MRGLMEKYPDAYGFKNFDDEQWTKLEESWRSTMNGLKSMSMALLAGDKDDPLMSNVYGIYKMVDSAGYVEATRKSMALWNELTEASTSDIKMDYEVQDFEYAGKKGLVTVVDIAAAAGDENVPMVKPMFQAMFGSDAKMRMYVVPADAETIVYAMAKEEDVGRAIEHVAGGSAGLGAAPAVKATADLLEASSPWTGFVSPHGAVLWFGRFLTNIAGPLGGAAVTIPEYPAGPPLGFSANLTAGQFQGEMVVPEQTLKDLAAYIKKCRGM